MVFAASLVTALMNLSIDIGDKMTRELKAYGANIQVVPKSERISLQIGGTDFNPLRGRVFLEERYLANIKDIFWRNNIVGFAPFFKTRVNIFAPEAMSVPLIGTYFNKHLPVSGEDDYRTGVRAIYPHWQVRGQWPRDDEPSGVLAGAGLARSRGWQIGREIRVRTEGEKGRPERLIIKGILRTGGPEENGLVAPLSLVQRLSHLPGKVHSVQVSALTVPEDALSRKARRDPDGLSSREYDLWYCTAYVSSISYQLEEAIPGASARPIWQVAGSEGAVVRKIQMLMLVVTLATFMAAGLGISSLMSTMVMERSREIGLQKALGAFDWEVSLLFLIEAAIIGVIGGVVGWAVGTGLSQVISLSIFRTLVSLKLIVLPVVIGISVLIAVAGSWMPSRLITRLYPAEVLHGRH